MNGPRKFKSLRLVRFGEILYDQQKRLIMLCRSCQGHYLTLESFQMHLKKCIKLKRIVTSIDEWHFVDEKRETRLVNGKQELVIYEPESVRTLRDIDWEAELEDPRWYTDDVNAKQPSTNAKENLTKARTRFQTNSLMKKEEKEKKHEEKLSLPTSAKRSRHSTPIKRPILTNQQQIKSQANLEPPIASVKSKSEVHVVESIVEAGTEQPIAATTKTATTGTPSMGMEEMLNKLRAYGVQVKRGNSREAAQSDNDAIANIKKQQALDIMRKLQSKGIKCTKVKKS